MIDKGVKDVLLGLAIILVVTGITSVIYAFAIGNIAALSHLPPVYESNCHSIFKSSRENKACFNTFPLLLVNVPGIILSELFRKMGIFNRTD